MCPDYISQLAAECVEEILEATSKDGGDPFFTIISRKMRLVRCSAILDAASIVVHMPSGSDLSDAAYKLLQSCELPAGILDRKDTK